MTGFACKLYDIVLTFHASGPFGNQDPRDGEGREGERERGGCSTCQRGLRISFTGGLGLCVGRHDGVKHGWRQPHDSPISGDKLKPGRRV